MLLLFKFLVLHFICDYPLQGDFLARGKNHINPIPGVPWYQCLIAHCFIQSGGVYVVTGRLDISIFEFGAHFIIDRFKCAGKLTFNQDQILHIFCKIMYTFLLFKGF